MTGPDRQFLKRAYRDTWDDGNRREMIVCSFLESLGFEVELTGFMALSNEYNPASPPEKAIPDLAIYNNFGKKIWFEVTGTNNLPVSAKIWVRPDKVDFAKRHRSEGVTYLAHVITSRLLVRFVDLTNILENRLSVIRAHVHGYIETFYAVPFQYVISMKKMRSKLMGWKNAYR
ncbi:MAG: hypothetical protein ACTSX0_05930 [Promethearchaeota archaeon]